MKLYYFPVSPYSQKALIALDEKNVQAELQLVNLADKAEHEAFSKISRFGKVPYLRDEARDWGVPESSIIIEYVDTHVAGGTTLVPKDTEQSRQARFHDRIFDLYVTEPALKIFFDGRRPEGQNDKLGVEAAKKRIDQTYALYDEYLAKRTWVVGDAFSIGDISAAAALGVGRMVRPFDAHKHLLAYFGSLAERPSVAKAYKQAQDWMARG
jgi:glutathione S-transferase